MSKASISFCWFPGWISSYAGRMALLLLHKHAPPQVFWGSFPLLLGSPSLPTPSLPSPRPRYLPAAVSGGSKGGPILLSMSCSYWRKAQHPSPGTLLWKWKGVGWEERVFCFPRQLPGCLGKWRALSFPQCLTAKVKRHGTRRKGCYIFLDSHPAA